MALTDSENEFVKKLKRCPFCGAGSDHVVYEEQDPENYKVPRFRARVRCKRCGGNTGWKSSCCVGVTVEWETKVHWNNRAGRVRYGIY